MTYSLTDFEFIERLYLICTLKSGLDEQMMDHFHNCGSCQKKFDDQQIITRTEQNLRKL